MAVAASSSSSTIIVSQFWRSSSSINSSKLLLHRRSISLSPFPSSKLWVVRMSVNERGTADTSSSELNAPPSLTPPDAQSKSVYGTAKIHDFCLGIPYGGVVLGGGLLGFLFSRNPSNLASGFLFGLPLLALSVSSLNVWRQAKSSLPLVLGQAVLSAALLWKNFQAYSLRKQLIPSGLNIVISAAMLCFYLHVMISGGNPPPKKLQSAATAES